MHMAVTPPIQSVIGSPVTALSFESQVNLMVDWATHRLSKVVCVANVHMLMEAKARADFADVLAHADIVTPDGMPLVWLMNLTSAGKRRQDRVAGMDILMALCKQATTKGISLFFLGSEAAILDRMRDRLQRDFPGLKIVGMEPLPFRPLTPEEDEAIVQKINQSGAGLVLVSLGCPKQEFWTSQHKGKIQAVMIGLGGVFPVYAGIYKWAPLWVRKMGLEWLYRLIQEPKRLWRRYFATIPPFLYLALKQILFSRVDTPEFTTNELGRN
ncbi:WecB/TagA/CpsF family glycosyltransferase [Phormidium tenue FACHB-886]|nr:WecB/TagA/CpsF family glycosyltransferase [Phormidium tenue FACHB-886]